jgi:pyridoxine 5-phosphate synthase
MAELGGADQITVHLREDRRHIQDRDVRVLRDSVNVKLNLECACEPTMLDLAVKTRPDQVCLVPEKREEVTTEGGLDIIANRDRVDRAIKQLHQAGIFVSLFIDPDRDQIELSSELDADAVELHTGTYANATDTDGRNQQLLVLTTAASVVGSTSMQLHAGHGLTYHNVIPIAQIDGMLELNIGHSIVARSIFVGMTEAVKEMKRLCNL